MKSYFYLVALCFFVAAGIWKLVVADRLTMRIPPGWTFSAEYLGNLAYADAEGQFPQGKNLTLFKRMLQVTDWSPERAVIEDRYTTRDVQNGDITYDSRLSFTVDPRTATIINYENHPEATGLAYLFPQNAQPADYTMFSYYLFPVLLRFDRRERRNSMELHVYKFAGLIDFTALYRASLWAPAYSVPDDARVFSPDFHLEIWVEPVTGETVHMVEDDPGDYVIDPATGDSYGVLTVWSGKSTGKTFRYLLQRACDLRWHYLMHRRWIPLLLAACGLVFLALPFLLPIISHRFWRPREGNRA